jgi:SAM-dependent methyltransferase
MTAQIHHSAEHFGGAAESYERGRPGYRDDVVAFIADVLDLRAGRTVVDLAAGTGKFTRALVTTGADVIAVEPVAGMRNKLIEVLPGVGVFEGTAEAMPLPDASADAVTVAQAFHWFEGDAALAEIHRVLRPGGRLLLVWNRRDLTDPIQAATSALVERHRGDTPAHVSGKWRHAFERTELFGPLSDTSFPGTEQWLDADGVAERVASTSIIAGLPDREREALLDEVRALVAGDPTPRRIPYITDVHWCERRS